jgi:hypothetical protein
MPSAAPTPFECDTPDQLIHTSAVPMNNALLDAAIQWVILQVKSGYSAVTTYSPVVRSGDGVDPERFCLDQGAYVMKVANSMASWSGTFTLKVGENQTYNLNNIYYDNVIYFQTTPYAASTSCSGGN